MVGYLKSKRHTASDRRIIADLKLHNDLMQSYIAQGMSRDHASAKAANDMKDAAKADAEMRRLSIPGNQR